MGGGGGAATGLLTGGAAWGDAEGDVTRAGSAPPPTEGAPASRRSAERMAVLAIAHHNLAVEQEALSLPDEASRCGPPHSEPPPSATRISF